MNTIKDDININNMKATSIDKDSLASKEMDKGATATRLSEQNRFSAT